MKLSILICGLESRLLERVTLINELRHQIGKNKDIEIITEVDRGEMSIGNKRNILLSKAQGEYLCFFDDDDKPSKNYVQFILKGIACKPDCLPLMGLITWDGTNGEIFEHSIKYREYKTNPPTHAIRYERYPNHLNVIRADIAKRFRFEEISHGEDTDWATQINKSGLLQREAQMTPEVIYHYQFKSNKS